MRSRDLAVFQSRRLVTEYQGWNVMGMVVFEGHLVVTHWNTNTIYLYNAAGHLTSTHPVSGLVRPRYMLLMTDKSRSVLVISDRAEHKLHWLSVCVEGGQVKLKSIRTTQLTYGPVGMCVVSSGHLMICGPVVHRLCRFSSQGEEEGHVQLSSQIKPCFVTSCNDIYIISDDINNQVVWVKLDGTLIHTVQGRVGQGAGAPHPVQGSVGKAAALPHLVQGKVGQPYTPQDLTQDRNGRVLVADHAGNQVMVFDQHGQYTGQLLGVQDGIYQPRGILLDEHNDKLYVGCVKDKVYVMTYDYSPLITVCNRR